MVHCGGSLVSWLSKAQGCNFQSAVKAELVVLWWRILWEDLAVPLPGPVPLWVDNSAAVSLASHASTLS
jgi:hypothetical protein